MGGGVFFCPCPPFFLPGLSNHHALLIHYQQQQPPCTTDTLPAIKNFTTVLSFALFQELCTNNTLFI